MTFRKKLSSVLDECLSEHLKLERDVLSTPGLGVTRLRQGERMAALLRMQSEGIDRLIGDDLQLYREAEAGLRAHALHRDVFMQSLSAGLQAAGDAAGPHGFQFRRLALERPELGYSAYAELLNRALLDLPLCAAMRRLTAACAREIGSLPPGARALGYCCGPASEFLMVAPERRRSLHVELWDADPLPLAHALRHAGGAPPRVKCLAHVGGVADGGGYDLIVAPAALAHLPPSGGSRKDPAHELAERLRGLLAPGGRLLLASPLPLGGANPYRYAHRMLLEPGDDAPAAHRSQAELLELAPDPGGVRLLSEDLAAPTSDDSVFAVLELSAPPRGP